jgi:hypothetical protein
MYIVCVYLYQPVRGRGGGAKNLLEFCQNFGHVAKTFNKLGDRAHEVFTENMKKEDAKNKTESQCINLGVQVKSCID